MVINENIKDIMSKINIFAFAKRYNFLFLLLIISISIVAQQSKNKKETTQFQIIVTDEQGKPLANTDIVVGEGVKYIRTNVNGQANIEANLTDLVKFSLKGYHETIVLADKFLNKKEIILQKSLLFASEQDEIQLPYIEMTKRVITNGTVVISGKELEKYTGSDLRNAFTGLVAGMEVSELYGSPGLNDEERLSENPTKVDISIRGRSPRVLLDGVPTLFTDIPLDPSEIESVTIIKDIVAKAMYGPSAADGMILIKTKRGKVNERTINVNVEKGISIVDRMPTWTNGIDYARLNNKARENSLITPKYSEEAIAKYETSDAYNLYYPNNDYVNTMFKNTMSYNRANISTSGGNEGVRYFSYLGFTNEGDMFKIGSNSEYNRIISRSNLDIKINDKLKLRLGIYGALGLRSTPIYSAGTEYLAMHNSILDATKIPAIAFPIYANNNPELAKPWYAVTSQFSENPIGELTSKGFSNESSRLGSSNLALDFDMSHLVKGLTSETFVGFNLLNKVRKGKALNYIAYTATPTLTPDNRDSIILTKVHDGLDKSELSKLSDSFFQVFTVSQLFKHEAKVGQANLINTLSYNMSRTIRKGTEEDERRHDFGWSGFLNYFNKYYLQAVVNYAGSYSYAKENRYTWSPTIGAGWVISEENFMKSVRFIDYLKLRAEIGELGYDNYQPAFFYRDNYSTTNSGSTPGFGPSTAGWLGTATETNVPRTSLNRFGNPNLNWEKRQEFNAGFDASLFSNKLYVELTYFNQLRDGIITTVSNTIPSLVGLGNTNPKQNLEKIRYTGLELALKYSNKVGDFSYSVGANASSHDAIYEKVDEPNYRNSYQSLLGKSIYSYKGLVYEGRYATDAEALEIPSLYDAVLHAGDLKYKDLNNDNVIDDNDHTIIGNTEAKFYYAININLRLKGFELYVIGTGRAFVDLPLTNSYFWNGWGDGNYSSFVKENLSTGQYPRLTYNKIENNFQKSDFWLTDGSFFKIQNVQLAYHFPENVIQKINLRGMSVFVNGTNLHTFTKVKYVDPESINAGVTRYPLFMNITGGIKLTF
jgi:TonB-linked SusC/RagA family outer membrane protein